ncbi:MAG: alpha/beta hydrolase [Anaerolineales bacterium]
MIIEEYGSANNKCIVLIHGSFVTGEMWQPEVTLLEKDYHVLIPTLNGHNPDEKVDFPGIEQEASNLIAAVKEHHDSDIYAIIGSSLGGTIAFEIASRNDLAIAHIVSDGGFFAPMSPLLARFSTQIMTSAMIAMKNGNRLLQSALKESYPEPAFEMVQNTITAMSCTSIHNVFHSSYCYQMPANIDQVSACIHVWYGSKEDAFVKKSARHIKDRVSSSIVKEFYGMRHGELALVYPERYVQAIDQL